MPINDANNFFFKYEFKQGYIDDNNVSSEKISNDEIKL